MKLYGDENVPQTNSSVAKTIYERAQWSPKYPKWSKFYASQTGDRRTFRPRSSVSEIKDYGPSGRVTNRVYGLVSSAAKRIDKSSCIW